MDDHAAVVPGASGGAPSHSEVLAGVFGQHRGKPVAVRAWVQVRACRESGQPQGACVHAAPSFLSQHVEAAHGALSMSIISWREVSGVAPPPVVPKVTAAAAAAPSKKIAPPPPSEKKKKDESDDESDAGSVARMGSELYGGGVLRQASSGLRIGSLPPSDDSPVHHARAVRSSMVDTRGAEHAGGVGGKSAAGGTERHAGCPLTCGPECRVCARQWARAGISPHEPVSPHEPGRRDARRDAAAAVWRG